MLAVNPGQFSKPIIPQNQPAFGAKGDMAKVGAGAALLLTDLVALGGGAVIAASTVPKAFTYMGTTPAAIESLSVVPKALGLAPGADAAFAGNNHLGLGLFAAKVGALTALTWQGIRAVGHTIYKGFSSGATRKQMAEYDAHNLFRIPVIAWNEAVKTVFPNAAKAAK